MSIPPSGRSSRPVSMMLSGAIDFSKFNPANAPKTVSQIKSATNQAVQAVAAPVIIDAQPQAAVPAVTHATRARPKSNARKPSQAFINTMKAPKSEDSVDNSQRSASPSPERQVAVSSSSSSTSTQQTPLSKDNNDNEVASSSSSPVNKEAPVEINLHTRLMDCLKNRPIVAESEEMLEILKDHLEIFFKNPEFVPGGEGFTDDFILDTARLYKIVQEEVINPYKSLYVMFVNYLVFPLLNSEKNAYELSTEHLQNFANRCYFRLSQRFKEDFTNLNPPKDLSHKWTSLILNQAAADECYQQVEAPVSDDNDDVAAPVNDDNDAVAANDDNDNDDDNDVVAPVNDDKKKADASFATPGDHELTISYLQASYIEKMEAKMQALEAEAAQKRALDARVHELMQANGLLNAMNARLTEENTALRAENTWIKNDKANLKERLLQMAANL